MDSTKNPKIKITGDGSHTLYSPQFGQHYHNPNGAVAESKHNFFQVNGLYDVLKQKTEITILEIGFGTGLNLLLLADYLLQNRLETRVAYHSIEAYPVDAKTAASFNFDQHLHHPALADRLPGIFGALSPGDNTFDIRPDIKAHIFCGLFDDFENNTLQADFIFHDAFSPDVNPSLWTAATFKKIKSLSTPNAILSTYSSASKAKAAMAAAGWHLASARGALGKREMTVASPNAEQLEDFDSVNTERLAQRYKEGDFG